MHQRRQRHARILHECCLDRRRAVRRQVASLASYARSRGVAVGIGHLNSVTIKVLEEEIPKLRSRGYRLVRASEAVN